MTERPPLDEIDVKILSELQKDGRVRNNELASRVGISEPPCLRRVRSLRSRGIIKAISATLDERLLGYEVISFVLIQLVSQTQAHDAGVRNRDCRAFRASCSAGGFREMPTICSNASRPDVEDMHQQLLQFSAMPRGAHHQKLSGAGRRQGCAAADTGQRIRPRRFFAGIAPASPQCVPTPWSIQSLMCPS